jgi:hypothetical protein
MKLERSDGTIEYPTTEETDFFRTDTWWRQRNREYLDTALDESLPMMRRDLAVMAHAGEEQRRLQEKEYFMRQHHIERIISG